MYFEPDDIYLKVVEKMQVVGNCLFDSLDVNRAVVAVAARQLYDFADKRAQRIARLLYNGAEVIVPKRFANDFLVETHHCAVAFNQGPQDIIGLIGKDGYYAQDVPQDTAALFFALIFRLSAILTSQSIEVYEYVPGHSVAVRSVQLIHSQWGTVQRYHPVTSHASSSDLRIEGVPLRRVLLLESDHYRLLEPTDPPPEPPVAPVASASASGGGGRKAFPAVWELLARKMLLIELLRVKIEHFGSEKSIDEVCPFRLEDVVN